MSSGMIRIGEAVQAIDTAAIDRLVVQARRNIDRLAATLAERDRPAFLHRKSPLTFEEFRYVLENYRRARNDINQNGFFKDLNGYLGGVLVRGLTPEYEPTPEGWLTYLRAWHPAVCAVLPPPTEAPGLPERDREAHSLIIAGSRWGKSTLLKTIIHHYVANPGSAVLVLDPHGHLVQQIARWPEFARSGRLIFVQPGLFPGRTVGLNPLDGASMEKHTRNAAAAKFARIIGDFSADLTTRMQTILRRCIEVIYSIEGATADDLYRLLAVPERPKAGKPPEPIDDRSAFLLRRARSFPRLRVRNFFRDEFDQERLTNTRAFIRDRIETLLEPAHLEEMMVGAATVNLGDAFDRGKIVLVDLMRFGSENVHAVGTMFLGMVTGAAELRGQRGHEAKHTPVHIFIDEATLLAGPNVITILNELRKFGFHLTLAQQVEGGGFEDADDKKALFRNTFIKIIGTKSPDSYNKLAEVDFAPLGTLKQREFAVKWGDTAEVMKVTTDARFADRRDEGSPAEWAQTLARLAPLYRPAGDDLESDEPDDDLDGDTIDAGDDEEGPPAQPPASEVRTRPSRPPPQAPADNGGAFAWKPSRKPPRV